MTHELHRRLLIGEERVGIGIRGGQEIGLERLQSRQLLELFAGLDEGRVGERSVTGVRRVEGCLAAIADRQVGPVEVSGPLFAFAQGDSIEGHWEGEAVHEGKSFRLALDVAGPKSALVDYTDFGLYAIPFDLSVEGGRVRLERRPPNGPVTTFAGEVRDGVLTGLFTGAGAKDARFTLRRTSERARALREEEVVFRNGGVTLVGTLILPEGEGPFPAVVVTHGGAPEHRGDAGYRGSGVTFARAGVAALVYDKRGVGRSTGGDWTTSSIEDFARDALAGLEAIKRRRDVDPKRIGVAGHSQGGWIAPRAATLSRDVAFVVVTSPSGTNAMEQSIFHTSNLLRRAGYSEEVVRRAAGLRDRMYERARKGKADDRLAGDLEAASKEPWFEIAALPHPLSDELAPGMRDLLLFEPAPVWEKVRVPMLAIWGSGDIVLPAGRSREIVEAALERAGNRNRTLHVLAHADHNFMLEREAGAEWDWPRRPAELDPILEQWLGRFVKRGAK